MSGALWAENAPTTNATAPSSRRRVVILGDSITAGYGLSPAQAYPALLQQKIDAAHLPFQMANAGVSGDTTAGGVRRVNWALGPGADVLVVALGGNDGLRGTAPGETEKNLTEIIKRARAKIPGLTILVAGMQMPANLGPAFTDHFKAIFATVAEGNGATLIPYLLDRVGGIASLNQADGIHPTEEGQKLVAENVWKVLGPVLTKLAAPENPKP